MKVRRTVDVDAQGIGAKIKEARVADPRSLTDICEEVGLSRVHWYDIEGEKVRGALPEDTLRKIEAVLGIDFGVKFPTIESE
jgi:transcriptional regulator with XRE-family HTH domain